MNSVLVGIREIGPAIAEASARIEANGTLPADIVAMIRPTSAFRMYVPDELDGPGVTAWESLEVLEELAYHDGASGWCAMIGSTTSLMSQYLPIGYGKEIFGDPDAIGGGFAILNGQATPVDGGLRVSGRWQWGSGTRHCTWVGGGCRVVDDDGKSTKRDDGLFAPFVFVPADEVTFIDNWQVSGMSGTGSGDYEITDAFVPEGRWVQMTTAAPIYDNPLARFSFFGLLASGVAACAVGIARRSIDELVSLATVKTPQGSSRPLAERAVVQGEVAMAEARLASAWAFMRDGVNDTWSAAERGDAPSVDQKRQLRLAATHATQAAAEVTELMYKAGGGAAVYKTSPLQRCFRDVFVATQHAMVAPRTFELHGRLRFGHDVDTRTL